MTYSEAHALEVSDKSMEIINRRGYTFWKCAELNGDIIAVVKDKEYQNPAIEKAQDLIKQGKFPEIPTVYTVVELRAMCNSTEFKNIHEIKKLGEVEIERNE